MSPETYTTGLHDEPDLLRLAKKASALYSMYPTNDHDLEEVQELIETLRGAPRQIFHNIAPTTILQIFPPLPMTT